MLGICSRSKSSDPERRGAGTATTPVGLETDAHPVPIYLAVAPGEGHRVPGTIAYPQSKDSRASFEQARAHVISMESLSSRQSARTPWPSCITD